VTRVGADIQDGFRQNHRRSPFRRIKPSGPKGARLVAGDLRGELMLSPPIRGLQILGSYARQARKMDLRGFEPLTSAMRTRRSQPRDRPFLNPTGTKWPEVGGTSPIFVPLASSGGVCTRHLTSVSISLRPPQDDTGSLKWHAHPSRLGRPEGRAVSRRMDQLPTDLAEDGRELRSDQGHRCLWC
jgi:hypothetical protein